MVERRGFEVERCCSEEEKRGKENCDGNVDEGMKADGKERCVMRVDEGQSIKNGVGSGRRV